MSCTPHAALGGLDAGHAQAVAAYCSAAERWRIRVRGLLRFQRGFFAVSVALAIGVIVWRTSEGSVRVTDVALVVTQMLCGGAILLQTWSAPAWLIRPATRLAQVASLADLPVLLDALRLGALDSRSLDVLAEMIDCLPEEMVDAIPDDAREAMRAYLSPRYAWANVPLASAALEYHVRAQDTRVLSALDRLVDACEHEPERSQLLPKALACRERLQRIHANKLLLRPLVGEKSAGRNMGRATAQRAQDPNEGWPTCS